MIPLYVPPLNENFDRVINATLSEGFKIFSVNNKIRTSDGTLMSYRPGNLLFKENFKYTMSLLSTAAYTHAEPIKKAYEDHSSDYSAWVNRVTVMREGMEAFTQFSAKIAKITEIYEERANPSEKKQIKELKSLGLSLSRMKTDLIMGCCSNTENYWYDLKDLRLPYGITPPAELPSA